jgi:hypothetical protein
LPIEAFKLSPELCFGSTSVAKTFLSSGTTSATRSKSPFSELGLELYKFQSLLSFYGMLSHFFDQPETISGISLIPNKQTWPDSSLAQMLHWISEISPTQFKTPKHHELIHTPIWVFGTAFHYVNLFDQGYKCPLPKGSIVIETGGTKGQSRSVDKDELYNMIARIFELDERAIVSEYGMSELACQAYDFYTADSPRCYRFPAWVSVAVEQTNCIAPEGEGCLIVKDPLKVDTPYPIRTQDVVNLSKDATFTLLGRLPTSTLKGCSMLAEPLLKNPKRRTTVISGSPKTLRKAPLIAQDTEIRARQVATDIRNKFFSDRLKSLLLDVVKSSLLTDRLIDDLASSWKSETDFYIDAVNNLASKGVEKSNAYLLIGPGTHPIAIIHPIIYAFLLGKKIILRHTKAFQAFETWFIDLFKHSGMMIETLPSNYYIDGKQTINADKLIIFGEDKTICEIESKVNIPVQGFGSHIAINIAYAEEIEQYGQSIAYDSLAMRGLGCMRSRVLFIIESPKQNIDLTSTTSKLLSQVDLYLGSIESAQDLIAYKHHLIEHKILKKKIAEYTTKQRSAFAPIITFNEQNLEEMISDNPLLLPIVRVKTEQLSIFSKWLQNQGSLGHIATSEKASATISKAPYQKFLPIGNLNRPSFNGTHHQQSFFAHDHDQGDL